MSVIGIDLGTSEALIAAVNKGSIEIVQNEVSERKTPSLVGFNSTNRLLGNEAMAQIRGNAKNTCRDIKLLIGRSYRDPNDSYDIETEKFFQLCQMAESADGDVGFKVNYLGKEEVYSASQVAAMLLTKLKETTEISLKKKVNEAVIAVPSYYNDKQRQAILNASSIAGLNCVRVMNEHAATALSYGIYRSSEFDPEHPCHVMFCSMGHSHFSCCVGSFYRGHLQIVAEKCDRSLGGRFMDLAIMKHYAAEFEKKFKEDPLSLPKARFKLEEAANKCKKVLSANLEAPINVECLVDDFDLSGKLHRESFEEMCGEMMGKLRKVIEATVKESGLNMSQIERVEVVGGCSRVPFVQQAIQDITGKEVSKTLNADESVARGCALQAAMLSPLFKVREFAVADARDEGIVVGWVAKNGGEGEEGNTKDQPSADGMKWAKIFPERSPFNIRKILTFQRKEPFKLHVKFGDRDAGSYKIHVPRSDEEKKVKIRCRLDLHGIFRVEDAYIVTYVEKEVMEKVPVSSSEAMADEENGEGEGGWVEKKVMKSVPESTFLDITSTGVNYVHADMLDTWRKLELQMIATDLEVKETDKARNDVEALIYSLREKIELDWKEYVRAEAKSEYLAALQQAEDWLYDTFDATKQVYENKYDELKSMVASVERGFLERERAPEALRELLKAVEHYRAIASTSLIKDRLTNLIEECARLSHWAKEKQSALDKTPLTEGCPVSSAEVDATREAFVKMAEDAVHVPKSPSSPAQGMKSETQENRNMDLD